MLADLDLLLIAVFCTADDLLPKGVKNAKRMLTDAEVVTLCVAQAIMGIPSDARFLKTARKQLSHLFPALPNRPGYLKRRQRLSDTIEALIAVFASDSPGFHDDLVLVDSTPVECARSIETTRRSQLADAADYGYCASHSRYFWGFRLHGLFALDGTPRALALTSPKASERDVCLTLLERCQRDGHLFVIGDKGYAGRDFEHSAAELDATIIRPRRKDEGPGGPHLAPIRQRIESIFQTCKDLLTLERHGARTLHGLGTRISTRFLALAASDQPQPPTRPTTTLPRRLRRLNPWNYSSSLECSLRRGDRLSAPARQPVIAAGREVHLDEMGRRAGRRRGEHRGAHCVRPRSESSTLCHNCGELGDVGRGIGDPTGTSAAAVSTRPSWKSR